MALERDFEKFKGGPTPPLNDRLHVTINRKGIFLFNENTYRLFGSPLAVNFYYSRPRDMIAIEPAHPRLPLVFPVKKIQSSYLIHGSPFCRDNNISVPSTHRFARPDIDKGILML